jgi:septal ring factor EnvC (AmiA/AmiB activator)
MRACVWVIAAVLLCATSGFADDQIKPEQMKKMYDDALAQLKAAQDRKAELAKENEALAAKVEELKKQLASAQDQIQTLKREVSDNDQKTFFLRSYHAAWESFIRQHPDLLAKWKMYLGDSVFSAPQEAPEVIPLNWPLSITG